MIVLQKEKEMSCAKSKELRQMGLPSARPWFSTHKSPFPPEQKGALGTNY